MQINEKSIVEKVRQLAEPIIKNLGFKLFDVEFKPERGWVLRVILDKDGGITVNDCEEVSKRLSALLDVEDIIPTSYILEVSSPGLTRELTKPEHYEFFKGRLIRLVLREALEGKRELKGYIVDVKEGILQLREKDSGKMFHIPLSIVARANLEIEKW
ncbi:MAG: ribosome maturation factor RimP [Hydrogenobacter thermophilus]|uniref:ribosome maturation factor RimP n=1 Tax=Hydrogenobacter thermophilus TaxID=940 RepID=UPI0030F4CB94|nr:ribosome maturation factor RimP [Hydrogenobacter thermophilus]